MTIFNESTYEEVMHLRLSPLHVLTALSTLAVVLIILTIMLIAFTNLREFIPGYPSQQLRRQITQNALRVDSLLNEVQKKDRFLHSIQTILRNENLDTTSFVSMQQNVKVTYDTSMLGMSEEEAGFREIVEKEEKYNLKWLEDKPFTTLFVCGSHENFDQLYNYPVEEWKGGKKNFHLEKKWITEFRT